MTPSPSDLARYYPVARVAHLERLSEMAPGDFLFSVTRRDWDDDLAAATSGVQRVTFFKVASLVAFGRYATLEIPEPLAIPLLPKLTILALIERVRRAVFRRPPSGFVFYAIENLDQTEKVRAVVRIPRWLARAGVNCGLRCVLAVTTKAAFGTAGALETYRDQLGEVGWSRATRRTAIRTFPALAPADQLVGEKSWSTLGFLGSFEERKGVLELLDAWPSIKASIPDARLVIVGHGPLQEAIEQRVSDDESVRVVIDPPRPIIRSELRGWHVLTLPSRRTKVWREQIGLPILEGLSAGCEIVTSDETGIASWLEASGHKVVPAPVSSQDLSVSLLEALYARRSASEIQSVLPMVDGRILADRWMVLTPTDDRSKPTG